ncbi:MAG: AbgT family transporter [bacterium]|nr:AbgT family transporter [bacterium]
MAAESNGGFLNKALNVIEVAGNKLPDPAVLFLILMSGVWLLSWPLSFVDFNAQHPVTGEAVVVANQVSGQGLATLMTSMVSTFVNFAPLGVVLVALLGIGVAEHTGFIGTVLRKVLSITPKGLLTPMVILVGIASHYAVDAGYVLVIPLGGIIFYAAGRHPLAGIAAAFAGVSGGFSANFWIPSALDPLLQGFTLSAAQLLDPDVNVNVLCNNVFTAASTVLVAIMGWVLTDKLIEPRVSKIAIDGDPDDMPKLETVTPAETRGMFAALASIVVGVILLVVWLWPQDSALRLDGKISDFHAPIMQSIVPLIFLFFLVPAVIHGYVSGSVKSHRDIIKGMTKSMSDMGYYLVLAFFCSLFIWVFNQSNIGVLLSIKGADVLKAMNMPGPVTLFGIIMLVGSVNLLVGSASAKWGLISPVFVPMLMQIGISPDLTQAAYRVGDSTTNIITPLMPYFPLVVVFCQRYVKKTGIGTLVSLMLPYSITMFFGWSLLLILFWVLGIPLGAVSTYTYP